MNTTFPAKMPVSGWTLNIFLIILVSCGGSSSTSNSDSIIPQDSRFILSAPVSHTLIYTGPNDGQGVCFVSDYNEYVGNSIPNSESIWVPCGEGYSAYKKNGGDICQALDYRIFSPWDVISLNVNNNSLFSNGVSWNSNYEVIEERDSELPHTYGRFTFESEIDELPSTSQPSQFSLIYNISHTWVNYPDYLSVQSIASGTNDQIFIRTHIIITAVEIDNNLHPKSDTVLVTDEFLTENGNYVFPPSEESGLWQLNDPVCYRMVIEQIVSVAHGE